MILHYFLISFVSMFCLIFLRYEEKVRYITLLFFYFFCESEFMCRVVTCVFSVCVCYSEMFRSHSAERKQWNDNYTLIMGATKKNPCSFLTLRSHGPTCAATMAIHRVCFFKRIWIREVATRNIQGKKKKYKNPFQTMGLYSSVGSTSSLIRLFPSNILPKHKTLTWGRKILRARNLAKRKPCTRKKISRVTNNLSQAISTKSNQRKQNSWLKFVDLNRLRKHHLFSPFRKFYYMTTWIDFKEVKKEERNSKDSRSCQGR